VNELLFSLGNLTAVTAWSLLIFVPRWRGLAQAAATVAVPAILSVAYTALIWGWWSRRAGGFGTLAEVQGLFQTPELLLAGWLHYLAFDLFVGGWVSRESRRDGVPHLVVVPILLLTFLFGPIGYLTSLVVRTAWARRAEHPPGRSPVSSPASCGASRGWPPRRWRVSPRWSPPPPPGPSTGGRSMASTSGSSR